MTCVDFEVSQDEPGIVLKPVDVLKPTSVLILWCLLKSFKTSMRLCTRGTSAPGVKQPFGHRLQPGLALGWNTLLVTLNNYSDAISKSRANRQLIWFLIQLRVEWSLFGEKWSNRSRDINVFCDRGMAKKFCPFLVVIVVQLVENFTLVFEPYLGNAMELRHDFCAKMISWIWRHPH